MLGQVGEVDLVQARVESLGRVKDEDLVALDEGADVEATRF
jgi:hypothetical protein